MLDKFIWIIDVFKYMRMYYCVNLILQYKFIIKKAFDEFGFISTPGIGFGSTIAAGIYGSTVIDFLKYREHHQFLKQI